MTNEEFINKAKKLVSEYVCGHLNIANKCSASDVYVVWNVCILGNIKALLFTTLYNGMYYEVTYNKASNDIYFDAYMKFDNCVKSAAE